MTKYFCDCCKKEVKQLHSFHYLCHLDPSGRWSGQVDGEFNRISGRDESKQLCISCYNKIVSKSVSEFERMRIENEKSTS